MSHPSQLPSTGSFASIPLSGDDSLSCLQLGQGERLCILIHGSLCDGRYWWPQFDDLSAGRRLCSPSLRHYFPAAPDPTVRLDWRRDVSDLLALIARLSPDAPVDLIGHSRGGAIAYQLARQRPDLVRRLVLAEPGGATQAGTPADPVLMQEWKAALSAKLARGEYESAVGQFIDGVSRAGSWLHSPRDFKRMALDNAHTLVSQMDDPLPAYAEADVAQLALPVLLVKGQRSRERFVVTVDTLARWLPDARVVEIAGASHGMNLAHPRAFNAAVLDFLDAA